MKKKITLLGIITIGSIMLVGCNKPQESAFENVKVEYSGPDGVGSISEIKNIEENIQYLAAKTAGYSESQAEEIRDDTYYTDKANKFDKSKTADYNKYRDVEITVNKQEKLSNGDKILVKVKPNERDGQVKSEEKEFTVSRLPSKYYTLSDVLNEVKDHPIEFVKAEDGVELSEVPDFSEGNEYPAKNIFEIEKENGEPINVLYLSNPDLKEGDNYIVKLSSEYLDYKKEQGFVLKGQNKITEKIVCTPRYK